MSRLPKWQLWQYQLIICFLGKMLDVLTAENQQLRSNGDLHLKLSYPNGVTLILLADISIEQLLPNICLLVI